LPTEGIRAHYIDEYGLKIEAVLVHINMAPIIRHVKVKGMAGPDDPLLADYWTVRQTRKRESGVWLDKVEGLSRLRGD
jgi:hypothetical protein